MSPHPVVLAGASATAALVLAAGLTNPHSAGGRPFLVNESQSVPPGLYRRTSARAEAGAIVALSQPPSARAYLSRLGAPPDMLLLKRVAASAGEPVCASHGELRWPRGRVPSLTADRQGVRLHPWRGCRPLRSDEVLVLGDTPASFDSRYFGPVQTETLAGVYREIFTW